MKLEKNDLEILCQIAITAAKEAGEMIQSYAGDDIAVKDKESGSSVASQIVTEIDLKSQDLILQHIQPSLKKYDLGLLIEESDDDLSRFAKDYFWCIDPLDGTWPFVEKRPGYGVSLALVSREGKARVGVIYDPFRQRLYHAIKGVGAFRDRRAWELHSHFDGDFENIYNGGAVMNACMALEKAPACFVKKPKSEEGGGCLWDYAATACLFEEIGAWVSDLQGHALDLNNKESLFMNLKGVLYASHRQIAEEFLV